jgi:hypothetical protein
LWARNLRFRMQKGTEDELDRIRDALRSAIKRSTLRSVALRVGMSPTGLQEFVAGANPYGKTREKVRAWFYREAGFSSIAPDDAAVLLRRLVGTLPEPERGVARLLDTVESAYREAGMYSPEWVKRVRQVVVRARTDERAP